MVSGKVIPLSTKPPPLSVSLLIVTSPLVACKVPVCGALVLPILTTPKLKLDGVIESRPAARTKSTPVLFDPEIVTDWLAGEKT